MAGPCECIVETDKMLAEHNTQLVTTLFGLPRRVAIATEQIESGRGKKRKAVMIASFCPFCGERYAEMKAVAA